MTAAAPELVGSNRDPLRRRQHAILGGLLLGLVITCIAASLVGALPIPPDHVVAALARQIGFRVEVPIPTMESVALFDIRLPRVALGVGVGAALATAGASLQALFRNPLADPALIGVSGGAACGAVGWIVLGDVLPLGSRVPAAMPIAAFAGALAAVSAVYLIARTQGRTETATLLLAGIAMNALTAAVVGYLSYLGTDTQLRALTFWLLGGLGGTVWDQVWPILILIGVAVAGLLSLTRCYDLLALGETSAAHLGLPVHAVRRLTVCFVALGVGAAVALTGMIGFVGLAAPHLVRLLGGASHRYVIPGSALLGALLVVVADILARLLVAPAELPIGILTSSCGAPFFIWLLRHQMRISS